MKKRAFTLIELLIVVAIIAILAAIAVPNFLEAQMRSKVSRFMADARTAATALETYRVDSNRYPPPDQTPVGADATVLGPPWPLTTDDPATCYLPTRLTTPIAYLTSLPMDILPHVGAKDVGYPSTHQAHYVNDDFNQFYSVVAGDESKMFLSARTKAALRYQADPPSNLYDRSVTWHLHSHGPDGDHDDFYSDQGYPTAYDPTNGTKSDGDIFYFGPGRGFTSN